MRPKMYFQANELKIFPIRWPYIILLLAGVGIAGSGLSVLLNLLQVFFIPAQLFTGLGLALAALGLFFLFNQQTIVITVNSSRGIIDVHNHLPFRKTAIALPLSYFTKILIFERIKAAASGKTAYRFEICLESSSNSTLLIAQFTARAQVFDFVNKLQQLLQLDIYFRNDLYKKSDFHLKTDNETKGVEFSGHTWLKKSQGELEIRLKWKKHQGLLPGSLLLVVFYGLIHACYFTLIAGTGSTPLGRLTLLLLLAGSGALVLFFLQHILGCQVLYLGRESLRSAFLLGGIRLRRKKMNWDDLGQIGNSLNFRCLLLTSVEGSDILQEITGTLAQQQNLTEDPDTLTSLQALAQEQLCLDVSGLPVCDRIRIEQEIRNFML